MHDSPLVLGQISRYRGVVLHRRVAIAAHCPIGCRVSTAVKRRAALCVTTLAYAHLRIASPVRVGNTLLPAIDARWEAYGSVLQNVRPAEDACVFMIDFGDVRPLRDPTPLCVEHPDALMVSSDTCRRNARTGIASALVPTSCGRLVDCGQAL